MPKEPMYATGQGRTQSAGATTSAKRPLADVLALRGDVCLVPRGDISELYKWKDRLAAVSPNSNHVF